jgi:tetratricopeptide (TPR) repeat protein
VSRELCTQALEHAHEERDAPLASVCWRYLGMLSDLSGRYEEATELARKAYETIAGVEVDITFRARSINGYMEAMLRTSHLVTPEVVAIGETGIDLLRAALKVDAAPSTYRSLCDGLQNLAMLYRYLGENDLAHVRQEQAFQLMSERYRQDPAEYEIDYAEMLRAYAALQASVGDQLTASAALVEAISIYRRAAALQPDAFQTNLRTSLTSAAGLAMNSGEPQSALELISECIDLGRVTEAANPATTNTIRGVTAAQMYLLYRAQWALGMREDANAALTEAIRRRRSMEILDDDDRAELGQWINKHASYLVFEGRARDAIPYCKEALRILDPFVPRGNPYAIEFARATTHLGLALASLNPLTRDDQEQAIIACNDALARFRALPEQDPAMNDPYVQVLLESLIHLYGDTGRKDDAKRIQRELDALGDVPPISGG